MRFFTFLAVLGLSMPVYAGPTLIKDSRVRDLTATPVLGRGYSISTNTFQSTCLKDVVITEPSYDFQYTFREYDKSSMRASSGTSQSSVSVSYWWVSGTVDMSGSSSSRTEASSKHMVATLNMDSYYASVDEASTPLSDAAIELLARQDLPGFFAACGPYYIRGINRNAKFVSIFSYQSKSSKSDASFAYSLKLRMRSFWGGANVNSSGSFSSSSEDSSRSLTIRTRGWGLGKNEDASLISYDIESFKAAIKQAFISMQNPLTGRVTSMEVVPWVENTEFQRNVNIRGNDEIDGVEVPLYEKKDILNQNAEFMTEASRAARARLNIFYKAKVCQNHIKASWYRKGKLAKEYANKKVRNLRTGEQIVTLKALDKAVSKGETKKYWNDYKKFMYDGKNTVSSCLGDLMSDPDEQDPKSKAEKASDGKERPSGSGRGLYLKRFTDHKTCQALQENFAAQLAMIVDDHCMPELAN
jgi:hypothetical protein